MNDFKKMADDTAKRYQVAPEFLTVQDLYVVAKRHGLLDARIRITDAEAVSYYPNPASLFRGLFEVVIDISNVEPVAFDELDEYSQRIASCQRL